MLHFWLSGALSNRYDLIMANPDSVDAQAMSLSQLVDRVLAQRAPIRILRDGRAVVEAKPLEESLNGWSALPVVDALKPTISDEDALSPLDEDDWPLEGRP